MPSRVRPAIAPSYLFACLVLGGSAQGIWQNMVLQLAGIAIIAWAAAAAAPSAEPLLRPARQLLDLTIAAILVIALQLIPLPSELWPRIGPRAAIAAGYDAIGLATPPMPLALTPHASFDALLGIIPPLAIFCSIVRLKAYRPGWLAIALIAGTTAGILLGALQVASAGSGLSHWYLYRQTNIGVAVGFFANANHMATLLVVTLPFLAAIAASAARASVQRYSAVLAVSGGVGLILLVGIALNGSLAGYGLVLPVLAASALILLPAGSRLRPWAVVLSGILVIAAVAALQATSIGSGKLGEGAKTSVQSREDILATTRDAIRDYFPFGSGLGSFRQVYHLYEEPEQVTNTYVVHAHNDYAELALELGLAGIVLMLLFLAWWAVAVWNVSRSAEAGPFARAAAIASAAILVHSIVDFPLRTAAIAACFAMCLGLLASRRSPLVEESELRPARHVVIR
jgi:O-antigen ligase